MTEFCLILDYGADRILLYYRELFIPCIRVKRLANFDWINIYFLWEKILYSFLLFVFSSVSWNARALFIPDFRIFISKLECKSVIQDRKSTRLNSSHVAISYAVFC